MWLTCNWVAEVCDALLYETYEAPGLPLVDPVVTLYL
jgi:hypothetical protein